MEELSNFLSYYIPGASLDPFLACFKVRRFRRDQMFVSPGQAADTLGFIRKGSFRVYHEDIAGKEVTTWFSFEGMVITDMLAFYSGENARFYAQALEESETYCIYRSELEALYLRYPDYQAFGRKLAEEALVMLMHRTLSLHTKSAEERYLELLAQPEFMQKIPLKHLASYLGITDTSLSRLRRKIR